MPSHRTVLLGVLLLLGLAAAKKGKLHGPVFGCRVPRKFIVVSGCKLRSKAERARPWAELAAGGGSRRHRPLTRLPGALPARLHAPLHLAV